MIFGYARVSTTEQNLDLQIDALNKFGCDRIFHEKISSQKKDRPQYAALKQQLRSGDLVVIWKLDRLGRKYEEIKEEWRILTQEIGADIVVLGMPLLDTRKAKDIIGTLISDLILQLLSYVAHEERQNIIERTNAGLAAARARGRVGGRPKVDQTKVDMALKMYDSGNFTLLEISDATGVHRSTIYKYLKDRKSESE